jgi:two-component sensor histidine kinase
VDAELSAFGARAIVTGEQLIIDPAFAQTFALLIHELATNAVKHGSLSLERGRVVLDWKIDRSSERAQLQFSWVERGGPVARQPEHSGLGTRLLSSIGKTAIAFKDEGFEYFLTMPLSEVLGGSQ